MKALTALLLPLLVSVSALGGNGGEPNCLASCSFGDAGWYHFACLKQADVGTLIRQYNCEFDIEVNHAPSVCEEIPGSELRDVTSGPNSQAKDQFFAWCKGAGLFPRD